MSKPIENCTMHFLGTMTINVDGGAFGCSRVTEYGQEMVITEDIRTLNIDRVGNCFIDLVDDEPAQVARWGRVMFRRGPWPKGQSRLEEGSLDWQYAREAARQEAWKIPGASERRARFAEIDEEFGPLPATSQTLAVYETAAGA